MSGWRDVGQRGGGGRGEQGGPAQRDLGAWRAPRPAKQCQARRTWSQIKVSFFLVFLMRRATFLASSILVVYLSYVSVWQGVISMKSDIRVFL